jgi:hypothetical protein
LSEVFLLKNVKKYKNGRKWQQKSGKKARETACDGFPRPYLGRGDHATTVHASGGFHRLCNLFARPYSQKEGQCCCLSLHFAFMS